MPGRFVARDLRARRLKRILPRWSSPRVQVHALYRASRRRDPRVRLLVDHLRAASAATEVG